MQISEISIHNVRTIKSATFSLKNYSLLIGANNAGKSNIIDAIRMFYEHEKFTFSDKDFCWFHDPGDNEAWMEIEYILTNEEFECLKEDYRLPGNKLRVRKYFRTNEVGDDGKVKIGYYACGSDGNICNSRFYGEKNVGSGKLGQIIYIPAMSSVDETTKLSGPSPLRQLITGVLERVIEGNAAYKKLQNDISDFSAQIKEAQTEDEKSLAKLQSEISEALQDWNSKFEIDFKPLDSASIIKSLVAYKIGEAVDNMNPEQMGSGFQRHLVYSLIDIAARYPTKRAKKPGKDFSPSLMLLLFEEPEAFLHPDQQLAMCRNLKRLANDDINQVLISSHSPHFVSQSIEDLPSVIKLNKVGKITDVGQISTNSLQQILQENLILPDGAKDDRDEIDKTTDMEAIKYFLWLDPQRCGCFFSKHVLLVEGPTEKALFNYLIDKSLIKLSNSDVFILDTLGKWNMARVMRILGALKIKHSVLFDDDNDSPVQKPWNDYIINSKNNYTVNVTAIHSDIETLLGIDKPKQERKKPQHLMYKWISGGIEQTNQDQLLTIVSSTLNPK